MEEARIYFATGTRKRAVARVRLRESGKGRIYINGRRVLEYFGREELVQHALEPLRVTGKEGQFDVIAKIRGGGISGQAGALRLAIARALASYDEGLKDLLKRHKLLTRDPREKERMKYGKAKRRKSPQYSKR
ncbi:MAG: 30S ribosomal protein S9 [Candidatus Hydrothermota bacterium]|uniref:Small ribosomal subunit protein uS9 n=1 Tax=candidate division WOR-3 bacterium TaxID=2052148 RepID=A0A7C0XDT2_UNCW3|nr:30S ribosomal protein S9 [Candidatus Hydrothermae bacterium]RKY96328.1 MAG: 30S ribosomal protein S9 [Candidatus Hydrothermae bacterium]HDM90698.1 30S ribosomal protein S9 [candidate division WOR-3 bacterium]